MSRPRRPAVARPAGVIAVALLVVGLLALAAGCSGTSGGRAQKHEPGQSAAPSPGKALAPYTGSDFYTPPSPLPRSVHGTLLRYQPTKSRSGARTFRVMYLSESLEGKPIAVTGLVLVPQGAAPSGGRRVIALAHGTTGIADQCAPSRDGAKPGEIDLMGPWVAGGYVIAATDYEGLGTPGRHPYLVGESEGRSVLDAVRAARMLPGADAGSKVAIAGYSQGGHASLWANQIARSWTPELDVVGDFAGAPAANLPLVAAAAPAGRFAGGFFLLIVAGFHAAYPQADPAQILTPRGLRMLKLVDSECAPQFLVATSKTHDRLFAANPSKVEPWASLLARNDPGQAATTDPVLIVHSRADEVVPITFSKTVLDDLCAKGQTVERVVLEDGKGHVAAAPEAYGVAFKWLQDRFDGKPAPSSCPAH